MDGDNLGLLSCSIFAKENILSERQVATDALATLGTVLTAPQKRDAIHLAVLPATAAHTIEPGTHIGIDDAGNASAFAVTKHGIVDPFLTRAVERGEQFWFVIYPRVITSLRHVWAHPAFSDEPETPTIVAQKTESEQWMRKWAMEHVSADYYGDSESIGEQAAYEFAIQAGHDLHIGPYESARDFITDEWWSHWEAITGGRGQRDEYFSCAC